MRISKPAAAAVTAMLAATVVAAAPGTATASGHQATGCPAQWALLPASSLSGSSLPSGATEGEVLSVSALSAHDAWFAGLNGDPDLSDFNANAWQWNGRSVKPPSAQIPDLPLTSARPGAANQLAGPGSFDSDTDGWVLTSIPGTINPLISFDTAEHWHGGRWTLTPTAVSPHPATVGLMLSDVAALSPANAWAVGGFYQVGPGIEPGAVPIGALIEHWNGTFWSIVPNPASSQPSTTLLGLTAASPTDIWAVGYQAGAGSSGSIVPLAEHWDGTAWSIVPVPAGNQISDLYAVSVAGGQAWAAGGQVEPGTQNTSVPLIEHWDGRAWTVQQLPDAGNSLLRAIYAASPDDVWASGLFAVQAGLTDVFLHWDGHTWTTVPLPGPREWDLSYDVSAIGGTGPDDVWATGLASSETDLDAFPLLAHLSCR